MCAGKIRTHVSHDIRRDAFDQLQKLSFSFYDQRPVGWLMARLTSDCQRLSNILAWGVIDLIWGVSLMVGASAIMLFYNWKLAIGRIGRCPRAVPGERILSKANPESVAISSEVQLETYRSIQRRHHGCAGFKGVPASRSTISMNSMTWPRDMRTHSVHNSILSAIYLPIVLTLGSVAVAVALSLGGYQTLLGERTVGDVVMFMYFAMLFFGPIQDLSAWFAELQMAQASAERILNFDRSGA